MHHQQTENHSPPSRASSPDVTRTYLTTKVAARHLGLSHRTLEDWRLRGGGPRYRRFGRRVMYAVHDLDAFADDRVFTNTGGAKVA